MVVEFTIRAFRAVEKQGITMAGTSKFDAEQAAKKFLVLAKRKAGVTKADAKTKLKLSTYQWERTVARAKELGAKCEGMGQKAFYKVD